MLNVKERILNVARENQIVHIRQIPENISIFLNRTAADQKKKGMIYSKRGKNLQPRMFFSARQSFRIEER